MSSAVWLERTEKLVPTTEGAEEEVVAAVAGAAALLLLKSTSCRNWAATGCEGSAAFAPNLRVRDTDAVSDRRRTRAAQNHSNLLRCSTSMSTAWACSASRSTTLSSRCCVILDKCSFHTPTAASAV